MKDIVVKCKEEKCTVWKSNDGTEEYFYFSIMPDLRLYYHKTSNDKKVTMRFYRRTYVKKCK